MVGDERNEGSRTRQWYRAAAKAQAWKHARVRSKNQGTKGAGARYDNTNQSRTNGERVERKRASKNVVVDPR